MFAHECFFIALFGFHAQEKIDGETVIMTRLLLPTAILRGGDRDKDLRFGNHNGRERGRSDATKYGQIKADGRAPKAMEGPGAKVQLF